MVNRSAEHSIKGYLYQFLHTVYDILNQSDENSLNQIEGIEDLDIFSFESNQVELCQYKYHETKTFTNSVVAKPLGIMFNHFISNQSNGYIYKLIVHTQNHSPDIDESLLKEILGLKTARNYIDEEHQQYCTDLDKIKQFKNKLLYVSAIKFSELEDEIIKKIIDVFGVSEDEAKFNILPSALKEVNSMGTNSKDKDRTISTKDFKILLNTQKNITDLSFINRIYGEKKAIEELMKRLNNLNIKSNRSEYVIFIKDNGRFDLASLIIDVVQNFYYKGNKKDLKPVTFIVENEKNIIDLKKNVINTMKKNNTPILFNDGYEDYSFSTEIFNMKPISTIHANKINNVNFNFRLLSYSTFERNKDYINFENPAVFCIAEYNKNIFKNFNKVFFVKAFDKENILKLLGGK